MLGRRPSGRVLTALTAAALAVLTVVGAPPASAGDQTTVDVLKYVDGGYVVETVSVPAAGAAATADQLEQKPDVVAAAPEVTYHVDGAADPLWNDQDAVGVSNARTAWQRSEGEGQIIADLDAAADPEHLDLPADALVPGRDFFLGGAGNPWHGFATAGIEASRADNGEGGAGLAPGATVMPIRVCNDTGCPSAYIARGILWAVDHGADVINMSLGAPGYSEVIAGAIRYALDKNVSVVASAGNDGADRNDVMYPAATDGVIAVGATERDGVPSDWSEHGWQVDLATVGTDVLVNVPNGYATGSGTSFSAPAVSGAVAVIRSSHPGITTDEVQAALQAGADSSNWSRPWGAGRLDLPAAMKAADGADRGITATPGSGTLDVTWASVPGATRYTVRADGLVKTTVGGTSAHLTGFTDGTQVAVDVQPDNGARSRPVLATVGPHAPAVPVLQGASLHGTSSSATLDLTASVSSPATGGYVLLRNGVSMGVLSAPYASTPLTVSIAIGSWPTEETHWQLRSVDALGRTSADSNDVVTTGSIPAAPPPVTGLTGQIQGNQVLLTWDDEGSSYTYRVSVGGSPVATPDTAGAVVAAPAPTVSRTYDVSAVDSWGQVGPSASVSVVVSTAPVRTVSPAVLGTLAVGATVHTPDAFTGADSVVHRWEACGSGGGACTVVAGDLTHVIAPSELGKQLKVTATATNTVGDTTETSPLSGTVAATAPVDATPSAPVLGTPTLGNAAVRVSWSPPARSGTAAISGYVVRAYQGTTLIGVAALSAGTRSQLVTHLLNGHVATITVTAVTSMGAGRAATVRVVPRTTPTAPRIGVVTPSNRTALVRWAAPASNGGSPITRYVVRGYLGARLVKVVYTAGTTTAVWVQGLANGATYTFVLQATNGAGNGPVSARSTGAMPNTRPSAPRIAWVAPARSAAVVRWLAPVNGGTPLTCYAVRAYRGATLVKTVVVSPSTVVLTVTGLTSRLGYRFTVTAINRAGWGPASAASSVVVPRV